MGNSLRAIATRPLLAGAEPHASPAHYFGRAKPTAHTSSRKIARWALAGAAVEGWLERYHAPRTPGSIFRNDLVTN